MSNIFKVVFLYCFPVVIALIFMLLNYKNRVDDVANAIVQIKQESIISHTYDSLIDKNALEKTHDYSDLILFFNQQNERAGLLTKQTQFSKNTVIDSEIIDSNRNENELKKKSDLSSAVLEIETILDGVWLSNALKVSALTLLPFLLMGITLALSKKIALAPEKLTAVANTGFVMKFMLSCIMAICWIYILNPKGRGAGTIESYLIAVDMFRAETLPLYLRAFTIEPIVAGLLGWYLHTLAYLFTKIVHHDVASAHVYSHLFKKFLLIYGVAIVLPPAQIIPVEKVSMVVFLLGFSPTIVFSFLKDQVDKLNNTQIQEGYLTILPGISRWQVLRLEEDGIETMAELASIDKKGDVMLIPAIAKLVDYWVDIAQLYVIIGHVNYLVMKERCNTASGFIQLSNDPEFVDFVAKNKLGNAEEIAQNISRTFPSALLAITEKQGSSRLRVESII